MSKVSRDNKKKQKSEKTEASKNEEPKTKVSKINDGKCCRCVYRNADKQCVCKKSSNNGNYVARKNSCNCFKYND